MNITPILKEIKAAYLNDSPIGEENLIQAGKYLQNVRGAPSKEEVTLDRYYTALCHRKEEITAISYQFKDSDKMNAFAMSRGLTSEEAIDTPDLVDFVNENQPTFERYNSLRIDNKELLFSENSAEGEKTAWETIRKTQGLFDKTYRVINIPGWNFTGLGLVHQNLVKWKKVYPIDQRKGDGKYHFEVVSQIKSFLGTSRHCWFRLIDNQGKVYSIGLGGKVWKFAPLRSQIGRLYMGDPGETRTGERIVTPLSITKEQFDTIIQRVEQDQNDSSKRYFHMTARNCARYVTEVMRDANIVDLDNREHFTQAIARKVFMILHIKPGKMVLAIGHFLLNILRFILFPIGVLIMLLLGAGMDSGEWKKVASKSSHRNPFKSLWSYFSMDLAALSTGWKVTEWQRAVNEARQDETDESIPEELKFVKKETNMADGWNIKGPAPRSAWLARGFVAFSFLALLISALSKKKEEKVAAAHQPTSPHPESIESDDEPPQMREVPS